MDFTKEGIVKFKRAGRRFTTYGGKKLTSDAISWFFEKDDGKYIEWRGDSGVYARSMDSDKVDPYAGTNRVKAYNIIGKCNFVCGSQGKKLFKYEDNTGTYYLLYAHKSNTMLVPHGIAVGTLKDGYVYFICEIPMYEGDGVYLDLYKVPEGYLMTYFNAYSQYRLMQESLWWSADKLTDECVECVKIAYDGIKKFDKIIKAFLAEKPMPKNWW